MPSNICPTCNTEFEDDIFTIEGDVDYFDQEAENTALRAHVARLEEALREISTLYWVDAPAPEEMREIARRALEEK